MDKISIIVPIYNGEKYLNRCIDSLIAQNYTNIEIILIDDGSTDCTLKICESYENNDKRVRVLSQDNQGQSAARNYGISNAQGDYYCFVDADDYVSENYILKLYDLLIQNKADISMCGFTYFYDMNVAESYLHLNTANNEIIQEHDILVRMHSEKDEPFVVVWGKLFKRELWNNIEFPVGRVWEDYCVLYQVFENAHKLVKSDEILYYYYRNNQQSSTFNLNKKFYEDMQYILEQEIIYMQKRGYFDIVVLIKKRYLYWLLDYYRKIRKLNVEERNLTLIKYKKIYKTVSSKLEEKMYHLFYLMPNLYCFFKK